MAGLTERVPGTDSVRYRQEDADLLRALLHCVRDDGGRAALDVLAERELDDSAASGAYQTPDRLAGLMAALLAPAGDPFPARVLDPACGSGSTLAAAATATAPPTSTARTCCPSKRSAAPWHSRSPRRTPPSRCGTATACATARSPT